MSWISELIYKSFCVNNDNCSTDEVTETDGTKTKPVRKVNLNRLTELPLSKVKHIIKLDPDVNLVNGELNLNLLFEQN